MKVFLFNGTEEKSFLIINVNVFLFFFSFCLSRVVLLNVKCLATHKSQQKKIFFLFIRFERPIVVMRYPCLGFPSCLKTFENGHVLRSHHLSCEHAQKHLKTTASHVEHRRTVQYDYDITGIKCNKLYPTFTGLDQTSKFFFRDQSLFGGTKSKEDRRIRKVPDPKLVQNQRQSTALDFSGYYT